MFEHREKWIWSLAEKWVAEHAFSLIEGNPETGDLNGSPLHLIKNVNGEWHYIRITKADYVWPQHMERDMAESTQTMLKKRAQLNYQPVHALYLYVFEQSPPEAVKERIITDQTPQTKNMHFAFAWIDLETQTFKASRDPVPIRQEPIEEMLQREPETLPDIPDIRTRLEQVEQQREKRRQKWFGQSRPNWTYILLGINVIMYLLLSLYGSRDESFNFFTGSTNIETLLQFGAKSGYHIINGEWWRLITPIFLHIGLMHFLFNSIALLSLGSLVEGIFGSKRFVWIYFLSGIAGNVASFVFSDAPGAGASGAIFGAMGAMIYFVLNSKTEWTKAMGRDVIVILGINVIIGFMHPSIDNFAHFGGLIGGFIVAAVFGLPQKPRIIWRSAGAALVFVILITSGYAYGMQHGKNTVGYLQMELQEAVKQQDFTAVENILKEMVKIEPEEPEILFKLGVAYLQNGKLNDSYRTLQQVITMNPKHVNALYILGVIAYEQGREEDAKEYLGEVLKLDPGYREAKELLDQIS